MAVHKSIEASWCLSHPVKRIKIYGGIGDYKTKANNFREILRWGGTRVAVQGAFPMLELHCVDCDCDNRLMKVRLVSKTMHRDWARGF
ncbi:hypothetical protein Bca101_068633 [Brassica carinata]